MKQDVHVMHLVQTHPSGAETWECPVCGRAFVMTWPPKPNKITLVDGDLAAIHKGNRGGVDMGYIDIGTSALLAPSPDDQARQAPDEGNVPEVKDEDIPEFKNWMDNNSDLWQKPLT